MAFCFCFLILSALYFLRSDFSTSLDNMYLFIVRLRKDCLVEYCSPCLQGIWVSFQCLHFHLIEQSCNRRFCFQHFSLLYVALGAMALKRGFIHVKCIWVLVMTVIGFGTTP